MTRALVRSVGGRPVAPSGLTVVPGGDHRIVPPRSARVARADAVVRAARLESLAGDARDALQRACRLDDAARRARARAREGGMQEPGRRARVHELQRARQAMGFETEVFVGVALDTLRARRALGADESRPLVVLGDHPDLPTALADATRRHPQVVHLPDA
ncbi:MAG: hypothetical protein AB1416_04415 [Actinomycetota bacterium]